MILKWTARALAAIAAGLIALIFVGESLESGFPSFNTRESILFIPFFLIWAGYIIGWKRELIGGLLVVGCLAVFAAMNYMLAGRLPDGVVFPVMGLPGLLFIVSALRSRKLQQG